MMKKYALWGLALLLAASLGGCGEEPEQVVEVGDQLTAGPVSLDEAAMTARIVGSNLEVYFPLLNVGSKAVTGSAKVTCRHLGGEKSMTGATSLSVPAGSETVVAKVTDAPALDGIGDQAEWIVDYTLELSTGKIRGKRSLFMLLDKADLIIFLPDQLPEGQQANIRAFLIDPRTNLPIANKKIELEVTTAEGVRKSYSAQTDENGVALVEMPPAEAGELEVKALVYGEETQGAVEAKVDVVRESKLLITTDKPLYQPGQTMHIRALALNRFDKSPLAGDDLLFEVTDAKGNKVFKRIQQTNEFGIAWTEFTLATQVILGPYTLRATVGEVVSEKTVTVDRYSLPKFKTSLTLDKGFYQPGQTVKGEVDVQYFFGKPVAGGSVSVQVYNYFADWVPEQEIVGKTNENGLYKFNYKLPDYLIGQPIEDGKALVLMEVTVKDTADHEQKVGRQIIVASNLLDIAVIPESGEVIPDLWNEFFVFVSDPTGQPVSGKISITVNGADLESTADIQLPPKGPAKVTLLPHQGQLKLTVAASDSKGDTATRAFDFSVGASEANVLLRTDRALYKVGDTATIDAFITGGYDRIFLDIVRKNQTVLTKTLQTEDGVARLEIDLDSELTEEIVLSAYFLADAGNFVRDTAIIYVQPASTLKVELSADKDEYMPGETATVNFAVKGEDDKPAQAALGLQVVDEAVFALSEIKPGLLQLFFQLEDEYRDPTYQIGPAGGFSLGSLITAGAEAEAGSSEDDGLQSTTKAAFAALAGNPLGQAELSTWKAALAAAKGALEPLYADQKEKIRAKLESRLQAANVTWENACTYLTDYLSSPRYFDFWEGAYRFEVTGGSWDCKIAFASNGPDERLGTADDWSSSLEIWDLNRGTWKGGDQGMPMAGGGGGDGDFGWAEEGAVDDNEVAPPNADPSGGGGGSDKSSVKVRSWFPETLFVEPSLITDAQGKAEVEIPLADSITEWRMTTMANSKAGQLGSRADGIIVFQDFFVDIDFPKYLTQNDELSFPVAVYNYLPQKQTIDIELLPEEWFELAGATEKTLTLDSGEVSVVYFPVKVTTVGWHKLTVYGMGDKLQDAVQRTVEVKPDGKEIPRTESARFNNDGENPSTDKVAINIDFPGNGIANSQTIVVKVLPGLSSHVVEGMESLLKLPGG